MMYRTSGRSRLVLLLGLVSAVPITPFQSLCQWTKGSLYTSADLYHALSLSGTEAVVVGEGCIYYTSDAGGSWQLHSIPGGNTYEAIRAASETELYAVGRHSFGGFFGTIQRSHDRGKTWTPIPASPEGKWSLHFPVRQVGYAVCGGLVVQKTTDGGETWTLLIHAMSRGVRDLWFTTPSEGVAIGDGQLFAQTTDGGNTWKSSAPAFNQSFRDIEFGDSTTGLVVGDGLTLRTTDGGRTWQDQVDPLRLWAISFSAPRTVWGIADSRVVARSSDAGRTWMQQTSDIRFLRALDFPDSLTGFIAGSAGRIQKTTDGGHSWDSLAFPAKVDLNIVRFADSLHGVVSDGATSTYVTGDGGRTWRPLAIQGLNDVTLFTPDSMVFIDGYGRMYRTVDGGKTITRSPYINCSFEDVAFPQNRVGWVSGMCGVLLKTTDAGSSWRSQLSPTSGHIRTVYFADTLRGFCADESQVFSTTDGGRQWHRTAYFASPTGKTFALGKDTAYLPIRGGMALTTDCGSTWLRKVIRPEESTVSLFFHTMQQGYATTDDGSVHSFIYSTHDGGNSWTLEHSDSGLFVSPMLSIAFLDGQKGLVVGAGGSYYRPDAELELFQNYPNPFNAGTMIRYYLPGPSRIHLAVYNVLGQRVSTLADEFQQRGVYEVGFPGGNEVGSLPSGIYLAVFRTADRSRVLKLLHVR